MNGLQQKSVTYIGDVKEIQTVNSFGSLVTDAGKRDREFQRHIYIAKDVSNDKAQLILGN